MNAKDLLAHYERIAGAPGAIARLRRFVLDLAVRRKLAPSILAAWRGTPSTPKMVRLTGHIDWRAQYGALETAAGFLRGLREKKWHHVGE